MIDNNNVSRLIGASVLDSNGVKIGLLEQIYTAPGSGVPRWMLVRTGLFGTSHTIVPAPVVADASSAPETSDTADGAVRVGVDKAFAKRAPRIDTSGPLTASDEDALTGYYGSADGPAVAPSTDAQVDEPVTSEPTSGRHSSGRYSADESGESASSDSVLSGPEADDADAAAPAPGRHRADTAANDD